MPENMEIERKFLVDPVWLRKTHPVMPMSRTIVQGYLSKDPVVRVRTDEGHNKSTGWLTVKGPGLVSRVEVNQETTLEKAKVLLGMCKHTLTKNRFKLSAGYGIVWEIDQFHGAHEGLWFAEVELEHIMQRFDLPATWVRKEVSNDHRYQNVFLAEHEERFWEEDMATSV